MNVRGAHHGSGSDTAQKSAARVQQIRVKGIRIHRATSSFRRGHELVTPSTRQSRRRVRRSDIQHYPINERKQNKISARSRVRRSLNLNRRIGPISNPAERDNAGQNKAPGCRNSSGINATHNTSARITQADSYKNRYATFICRHHFIHRYHSNVYCSYSAKKWIS
jgi:hypothetical protein